MKVLDLFSGIGGFSLGLERTGGFDTIAFCEIDDYCQKVLRKHWPHVPIHSDIRTLGAQHFEQYRKPDLICGGFPCQDISQAGRGAGLAGERSGLWFEMLRVICELRPRWVLVENVPRLCTKGADEVLAGLEQEGYTCWPTVVGAWTTGALHKRDRVWILAYAGDSRRLHGQAQVIAAECGIAALDQSRSSGSHGIVCDAASKGFPDWAGGTVGRPEPLTQFERSDGREVELSFRRVAHGVSRRVDRIRALGNSVVPQIPELFGRFILAAEAAC